MPDFAARIADGWSYAMEHLPLALVPILLALLNTDKLLATISFDGVHFGLKFGLPFSVITIWQFVSVPNSGVAINSGIPIQMLPLAIVSVPLILLIQAALTAGYFGSLRDILENAPYDFGGNVREYFLPFLLLTAIPVVIMLPTAVGLFGVGDVIGGIGASAFALVIVLLPIFFLIGYLFWATPYLIVLRNTGLLNAAQGSYTLAIQAGPYLRYTVGFALFVLAVSVPTTALVVNVPVVGLFAGVIGGAVIGLAANFATMRFIADIDPESQLSLDWDQPPFDGDSLVR